MNNLNVIEVSKSNSVTESLGITEERRTELIKTIMRAEIDGDCVTSVAEIISKECKHPNELFFIAFTYGYKVADMSSMERKMMHMSSN
jgi:hypothetical protein